MPNRDLIVAGASAGGIEALQDLLAGLPDDLAASIVVVVHMPPTRGRARRGSWSAPRSCRSGQRWTARGSAGAGPTPPSGTTACWPGGGHPGKPSPWPCPNCAGRYREDLDAMDRSIGILHRPLAGERAGSDLAAEAPAGQVPGRG